LFGFKVEDPDTELSDDQAPGAQKVTRRALDLTQIVRGTVSPRTSAEFFI